jgi:hypothetical protein
MFKHSVTEARKLWTEALRSGEFQQGVGVLCRTCGDHAEHCCLGVGCRLFDRLEQSIPIVTWGRITLFDGESSMPPGVVLSWLGLLDTAEPAEPIINPHGLAQMNDAEGKTFAEIADYIDSFADGVAS